MRQVTGGQPVFISDGPEYEISYYYGAPIQPLAWRQPTEEPGAVLSDNLARPEKEEALGSSRQLLAAHPTLEGRQLLLLKVGADGFESFPKEH